MGDPLSASSSDRKAAVVVIDNQFGILEGAITADAANEVWKQITVGLLTQHYDEIVVITGHHPESDNNPIVNALQRTTAKFGTVDMFTMMHTNMIRADNMFSLSMERSIAQIPFETFAKALSPDQRSHLRFLYSMGCYDGNDIAATVAMELGFKTYVGHEGAASNVIATYPLLARWMGGERISSAAVQTNAEINSCLPPIGEMLEQRRAEITSAVTAFLDCNREAGKSTPRDEKTVAACIGGAASTLLPIGLELAKMSSSCISRADEAFGHIPDPVATASGIFESIDSKVLERAARYSNEDVLGEILPAHFREKAVKEATRMKLVVYGQDIRFEDMPKPGKLLARGQEIKNLVALVMQDAAEFSIKGTMLAAAAVDRLQELGAKQALFFIGVDKKVAAGMRFEAATQLAALGDFRALRIMMFENKGNELICERLHSFGDTDYLQTVLHNRRTPSGLRHTIVEVFVKKGNLEVIKGLGPFFERHGAGAISIKSIWNRAKNDLIFAKSYHNEIVSLLSHVEAWLLSNTSIYAEMVETAPEFLMEAVRKTATRLAVGSGTQERSYPSFFLFAVALLFDKGKISESAAKKLLAQAKISDTEAQEYMGIFGEFDPTTVIQRLLTKR